MQSRLGSVMMAVGTAILVNVLWLTLLLAVPIAATVYVPIDTVGTIKLELMMPEEPAVIVATFVPVPGPE